MTREQWVDLVLDMLASGDAPQEIIGKYHPEIIDKHIGIAFDYLAAKVLYPEASKTNNWGALDAYAKAFEMVEIFDHTERQERYCNLPVQPISLPSNRGIRVVSPMTDQEYRFMYRDNNSNNIYGKLEVDDVVTVPRYYLEGQRLYFSKHLPFQLKYLLIKLIVPFSSLDYEDEVNIPQGYGKLVFDLVYQSLGAKRLEKVSNDNNANIP